MAPSTDAGEDAGATGSSPGTEPCPDQHSSRPFMAGQKYSGQGSMGSARGGGRSVSSPDWPVSKAALSLLCHSRRQGKAATWSMWQHHKQRHRPGRLQHPREHRPGQSLGLPMTQPSHMHPPPSAAACPFSAPPPHTHTPLATWLFLCCPPSPSYSMEVEPRTSGDSPTPHLPRSGAQGV